MRIYRRTDQVRFYKYKTETGCVVRSVVNISAPEHAIGIISFILLLFKK